MLYVVDAEDGDCNQKVGGGPKTVVVDDACQRDSSRQNMLIRRRTFRGVDSLPLTRPSTDGQWEVGSGRQLLTARLPRVHNVEAGEAAVGGEPQELSIVARRVVDFYSEASPTQCRIEISKPCISYLVVVDRGPDDCPEARPLPKRQW